MLTPTSCFRIDILISSFYRLIVLSGFTNLLGETPAATTEGLQRRAPGPLVDDGQYMVLHFQSAIAMLLEYCYQFTYLLLIELFRILLSEMQLLQLDLSHTPELQPLLRLESHLFLSSTVP